MAGAGVMKRGMGQAGFEAIQESKLRGETVTSSKGAWMLHPSLFPVLSLTSLQLTDFESLPYKNCTIPILFYQSFLANFSIMA